MVIYFSEQLLSYRSSCSRRENINI